MQYIHEGELIRITAGDEELILRVIRNSDFGFSLEEEARGGLDEFELRDIGLITQDEFSRRNKERVAAQQKLWADSERATYERLKAKFGG